MPFADEMIGRSAADRLVSSIAVVRPRVELVHLRSAAGALDALSLRQRSDLLRDALLADVPGDYAALDEVVRAAAAQAPHFTGWLIWPVTSAIAVRAVQEDTTAAFDAAMALLAALTDRLSAEFAIRVLLRHDLDRALATMREWTVSPNEHIRRLASEGARPYLPWAARVPEIIARPDATVPILDALYRDDSDYVRRSVANHLNDLSRDHPALVASAAERWLSDPDARTAGLVRKGLRTLIKRGDPVALTLMGFNGSRIRVGAPELDHAEISFGGQIRFRAEITNQGTEPARVAVDYVIHHRRSNGHLSPKVFKLTTAELAPGESLAIDRTHSFRAITTRRYYPGPQAVALQVNGASSDLVPFEILPAEQHLPVEDQILATAAKASSIVAESDEDPPVAHSSVAT